MWIKATLRNARRPDYAVVTIPFPIPTDQYDSTIKMLEALDIIEGSSNFTEVEALAAVLEQLNRSELALYRAVLSATNCTELSQAFELRNQLDQYILAPEISTPEDQARAELALMLPKSEAQTVASHLNLYAYGRELMEKNNSVQTDYGLLERRDGQPIQTMEEPHLEMGGMKL